MEVGLCAKSTVVRMASACCLTLHSRATIISVAAACSVLYLCWALLWRYASGFWLYPFLDFTKTPQAYPGGHPHLLVSMKAFSHTRAIADEVQSCAGLFVAHNLFFLSVLGLDWMKKTWLARRHMKQRPPQLKTA